MYTQSWCKSLLVSHHCVEVHRGVLLRSSSLLLQQCSSCLVCLIWMFLWWVVSGHTTVILLGVASRICSKQHFSYLGSSVSSTETDINTRLAKAWTAIDRLSVVWKSDLTNKMKCSFFQTAVVSIRLYRCTTWTLTKHMEKKLNSNYTRMLRAILNKSWRLHPTKQQLYSHLPPDTKTIKIRRTRDARHCRRSRDELISDVLLWTPSHGWAKAGCPARTYIQQFCADTGCSPEDLPKAMDDREARRERVRNIHADSTTSSWWLYIYTRPKMATQKRYRNDTRPQNDWLERKQSEEIGVDCSWYKACNHLRYTYI